MLSRLLLLGLVLLGGGGLYRHFILGDWGWERIHPAEFSADGCDIYYAMLGLGQDPAANPANAPLVERCQAQAQDIAWVPSQIGDVLRFDRPSLVRLRVDVIDMAPDYQDFMVQTLGALLDPPHQRLLETLETLTRCEFSLRLTARQLGVHENTVKYRLRRITEMVGGDPARGEHRLEIELALKIRHLRMR